MKILTEPIESFSFKNIVDFCTENEREGVQLDYKINLTTGSLSKHFAAFSNTLGGVIIIGIEEDKNTGFPIKYDGIVVDRQNIEKITQWANNVSPLPKYTIHSTNTVNGLQFILIRIFEGDNTPYYVQNDGRIYIRTNDITKELIDIASSDYSRLLYAKQDSAKDNRNYYIDRAHLVRNSYFVQADGIKVGSTFKPKLFQSKPTVSFKIQPHYPNDQLVDPNNLINQLSVYQSKEHSYDPFPANDLNPIPDGAAHFSYNLDNLTYLFDAVFSQGLLVNDFTIDPNTTDNVISLDYIAGKFFVFLQSAQSFYKNFNYQGVLQVRVNIEKLRQQVLRDYRLAMLPSKHNALLDEYAFYLTLDTNELFDNDKLLKILHTFLKEFYWNLGFSDYKEELINKGFKETHLLN